MKNTYLLLLVVIWLGACQNNDSAPDVSSIDIDPELVRFEQLLSGTDTLQIQQSIDQLTNKYSEFTEVFLHQIIADPAYRNDVLLSATAFLQDSFIQVLHHDCRNQFLDFDPYYRELKQALKYFAYYFPDLPVPDIYTCISGFEYGSFTIGGSIIGIGLDFYLGPEYSNYDPSLFPEYIQRSMTPDYLVSKSIQALVANYIPPGRSNTLLDFMIRNGIELYLKNKLLPTVDDEIIYEYNADQLSWLVENESQIWAHLVQEDLLYSTNYRNFQKIVEPSPGVPNMPPDAPGRLGNWIGERIIASYMDRHPELDLRDLIIEHDAQYILTESKYKPRQ